MKINATWHRANKMPANPILDQRLVWHAEHAKKLCLSAAFRKIARRNEKEKAFVIWRL